MAEEGAPVSSLGGILGVMMIVVVVLGLLFYGFINAKAFSWENIMKLAPTLYLPVRSEELGSVQEAIFSGDVDYKGTSHLTATRVGCEIAKKIRDDYAAHGDADRTEGENILDGAGEKKLRFMSSGKFRLEWNSEKSKYWNFADLSLQAQEKIKSDCRDTTVGFNSCIDRLDEACITAIFKNLKVPSGQNFCGSFVVGANSVSFGNKECGEAVIKNSEGNAWVECSSLCPGGDKLTWRASSAESVPELSPFSFSEEQIVVKDDVAANKFPPECSEKGCEPEHIYTIFWNKERKIYEVHIRKSPMENSAVKNVGVTNAVETIAKIFKTEERNGAEGAKLPEARLKVDFVFKPIAFPAAKPEYFLSDFANDILEKVNGGEEKKWTVNYEDCSGNDCITSMPQTKVHYKNRVEFDPESWQLEAVQKSPSEKEVFKNRRVIYIKTPLKSDKLESNKAYRVLVYKWIRATGEKEKVPRCNCGVVGQNILSQPVWCPKEDGWECKCQDGLVDVNDNILKNVCNILDAREAYAAESYSQYKLYATIDYTIVILEAENIAAAGGSLSSQSGTDQKIQPPAQTEKTDLTPRISVSGATDPNKIKINIQIINSGLTTSKAGTFNFQITNANSEKVHAETLSMPAIAAGDIHIETWPVDYSHASGNYKLTLNVDVHEDIDELDETNNQAQDVYTMPLR